MARQVWAALPMHRKRFWTLRDFSKSAPDASGAQSRTLARDRSRRALAERWCQFGGRLHLTDLCGSMTNFRAAPLSKSLYPLGASSSEISVTFTALAIWTFS
jgi:hypothetical protein